MSELINCRVCDARISKNARSCPGCGEPDPNREIYESHQKNARKFPRYSEATILRRTQYTPEVIFVVGTDQDSEIEVTRSEEDSKILCEFVHHVLYEEHVQGPHLEVYIKYVDSYFQEAYVTACRILPQHQHIVDALIARHGEK